MGRCWTPSQRTPVQYNAGETRAAGERLGVAHSEVGTVCASSASTGLCGGQLATAVPTATNPQIRERTASSRSERNNARCDNASASRPCGVEDPTHA
jgi:hypothetical protein